MGVLEGVLLAAVLIVIGWAGYRTGWEARDRRQAELGAAEQRRWFELSLILAHHDDAELVKLDAEFGCDAVGRLRGLGQAAIEDLRAGKGRLFEELSDHLLLQERRQERLRGRLEADPCDPATSRFLLRRGAPSVAQAS